MYYPLEGALIDCDNYYGWISGAVMRWADEFAFVEDGISNKRNFEDYPETWFYAARIYKYYLRLFSDIVSEDRRKEAESKDEYLKSKNNLMSMVHRKNAKNNS